ncbi:hypothetical protein [Sphingomonas sp.]|uniref:hypothetical protein n=1 Tax=Sphingomonas sp. TaxID=28214 RepID=UPI003B00B08E
MAEDKLNAMGMAMPGREQPVRPHDPTKEKGERQDGAGVAPPRADRTDAVAPGTLADERGGPGQGTGSGDPFAAHRGEPARIGTGAAQGAGAGAGGSDAELGEDPDADEGGGGRPRKAARRPDVPR